jgi:hypothetical protein
LYYSYFYLYSYIQLIGLGVGYLVEYWSTPWRSTMEPQALTKLIGECGVVDCDQGHKALLKAVIRQAALFTLLVDVQLRSTDPCIVTVLYL